MADDTERSSPLGAAGPASRPPGRQALLDVVYARADVLRRRRAGWLGIGTGAVALFVIVGMLAVVPDRTTDGVLTAELADNVTSSSVPEPTSAPLPSETTETVVASEPGSTGTTATSETTFVHQPTSVPGDRSSMSTASSSTAPETSTPDGTRTTVQAENQEPTIKVVSKTPASPKPGEMVTVQVRLVDPDTELVECGHNFDQSSGSPTTMSPPQCPSPTCTGGEPEEPPAGSTDRIDTFTYTYESAGTYEFYVAYQGGECTTYWDNTEISSKISVG